MNSIPILIYEDNTRFREGLETFLSLHEPIEVRGAFANPLQVEEHLQEYRPRVILMDIDMPGITGIEALKRIKRMKSEVDVIMLTVFEENDMIFESVCMGASGYLLKKTPPEDIAKAIIEVIEGGAPMTPSVARKVLEFQRLVRKDKKEQFDITDRETDLLRLLADGHTYKTAAKGMGVSMETVRSHIKNIYKKLHVHSMTEAVVKAMREGLV